MDISFFAKSADRPMTTQPSPTPAQPPLWTSSQAVHPPTVTQAYRPRQPGEHWRTTPAITFVTVLYPGNKMACDPTGYFTPRSEDVDPIIAVFRGDSRQYRPYEYRPGLRYARLMRVIGRR